MAFNLDFSHIPDIPGVPTLPSFPSGISDTGKALMDKMTTDPGSLFSNPMVNSINLVGTSVDSVEGRLKDIAAGGPNPSITAGDATTFLTGSGISDIRTTMGNFFMHTNRLSGVLQSQGIKTPGLQQILSIGTQMQNMLTLLQGAQPCLPVLGGATGLFASNTLDSSTASINDIVNKIDGGIATIGDVSQAISNVVNLVKGIMDKDSLFLQNCVNQLQAAAVALAVEALDSNPCAHFILNTIQNQNPGGVMDILAKPIAKV